MKKTLGLCLAILAIVGLTASASLAETEAETGFYLSIQGGGTELDDADIEYDGVLPGSSLEAEFDTGFNAGAAIGFDFGVVRLEAEAAYRENDFDKFKGRLAGIGFEAEGDGDVTAESAMGNLFFDISTGTAVVPYIGGGAGMAKVSYNDAKLGGVDIADDDDEVFAWQVGAGVAFTVNPTLAIDLGYRFFTTEDPELEDESGTEFETEYETHNASLGLRFTF